MSLTSLTFFVMVCLEVPKRFPKTSHDPNIKCRGGRETSNEPNLTLQIYREGFQKMGFKMEENGKLKKYF